MGKILKSGKVVVVLAGRYAGRKAVVIKTMDKGDEGRKFGYCLVVGIDRYPRKITRAMGKKKAEKRSKVKPFIKCLNYNHVMPTRYQVDIHDKLKKVLSAEVPRDAAVRHTARKEVKAILQQRYKDQNKVKQGKAVMGVGYLFKKLRF